MEYVRIRNRLQPYTNPVKAIDPKLDAAWASGASSDKVDNTYFDYYYSGQDVLVYVAGAEDMKIPVEGIGFKIEQNKVPVFGAHSFTYDAVMRGTRLVSGSFRITTTKTNFMLDLIAQQAKTKVDQQTGTNEKSPFSEIFNRPFATPSISDGSYQDSDADNIDRYWNINPEKSRSTLVNSGGRKLFSSHPPFSFVIVYGLQSASISQNSFDRNGIYEDIMKDSALYFDTNERLVNGSGSKSQFSVIDSIELVGCEVELNGQGQAIAETYTFFARDYII